jgi:NB-ARC domain
MQNQKVAVADENLAMELESLLIEKKIIILDDVSTVDLWDRLKILSPDSNNGSRVLITSRSIDVAMAADPETTPYKLSYLTEEESVQFLLTKAFPHKKLENCPPDLMKAE